MERAVVHTVAPLWQSCCAIAAPVPWVLAVTKAESEHAFAYETSDGVAAAYGITQLTGNLDDELRYVDRLRAVTSEQIRDAARKYLPLTDYACIAFVPGGK